MNIKSITNEIELLNVILFLKNSFKWSSNKANQINKSIIISNRSLNTYGYFIEGNNGKVLGALLIFDQGYINYGSNAIKKINISSWYISKSIRGYFSLLMIKKLIFEFKDSLITNISANEKAYKIFKMFGFQDSIIYNRKFLLTSILFRVNPYKFFKIIFNKNKFLIRKCDYNKSILKGNSLIKIFNFNNQILEVIYSNTILEKRYGLLSIKIRGTRILWTSNDNLFKKFYEKILFYYFFQNFSLFFTVHCRLDISISSSHSITRQIYFYNQKNVFSSQNLALGSELSFFC